MNLKSILLAIILQSVSINAEKKPNIIFIYADDMGVGDMSHSGGMALTPALDKMAKEGMRFTDAHTTSSVCTPSRYGLLTGRYNWRTHLQKSVYFNPKDKPLIKNNEETVATLLKGNGYNTACIGKWHLGIGWQFLDDYQKKPNHKGLGWNIDYSKPAVTPTSNGFDYFYGIQSSLDMAPYIFIKNEHAVGNVSVVKAFDRPGAGEKDFEANQCLKIFASQSTDYIDRMAKEAKPFFLYLPLTSPHTPIVPSSEWLGKSPIGKYGDFLMETDWVVGEILQALDRHSITDNTLVIFSSDNGCSPAAKISALEAKGHKPNGDYRGHKADIYEGGHRVPMIARWPNKIAPGSVTNRLTTLADFYATCADIIGVKVKPNSAVDSISFYPTLKDAAKIDRSAIVMHSINGAFAIRKDNFKLCFCGGSGGWSKPKRAAKGAPKWQLFDLQKDPHEKQNLYEENPTIVKQLHELMLHFINSGRSTPGPAQANDAEIIIDKE